MPSAQIAKVKTLPIAVDPDPSVMRLPTMPQSPTVNWVRIAETAYISIAGLLLGRFVFGLFLTRRVRRNCGLIHDQRLLGVLAEQTAAAGIRKPPALMESGALMIYLADKTGKLLPKEGEPRYRVLEWLMWQMGGPGPMFGQVHHFVKYNPGKAPYAEDRYLKEAHRLYGVLDRRLADRGFVAGALSVADFAILGWAWRHPRHKVELSDFPNVERWYNALMARPGVKRGMEAKLD